MRTKQNISLEINRLSISVSEKTGWLKIIQDLTLHLPPGKTIGLIGESGCGKSLTAMSILRLLPHHFAYGKYSEINLHEKNLLNLEYVKMQALRGKKISLVCQEPMLALNPVRTMYKHLKDVIEAHQDLPTNKLAPYISKLMQDVELGHLIHKLHEYPHQWSGGQKQRFIIAMALANKPEILLADEPTTALDLVVQKQILALLKTLQHKYNLSLLIISHDFNVIKNMADYIVVMYAGQVIEHSPKEEFWSRPLHPYVHQLLNCVPTLNKRGQYLPAIKGQVPNFHELPSGCRFHPRCSFAEAKCRDQSPVWYQLAKKHQVRCHLYPAKKAVEVSSQAISYLASSTKLTKEAILEVSELWVSKSEKKGQEEFILKDINFKLKHGKTLAIVGESGSGKTTLAHVLMGLMPAKKGNIFFSENLSSNEIQFIFQDPSSAMNPRWSILEILKEGKTDTHFQKLSLILDAVQMPSSCLQKYPHELSGGQRQRIAIARALLASPKLLICDEPTSALDISVQAQILNLLQELKIEMKLTYMLITHDLEVVSYMADQVLILQGGEVVEQGNLMEIWHHPEQDYTKLLLSDFVSN